jgi:hypothetical protein
MEIAANVLAVLLGLIYLFHAVTTLRLARRWRSSPTIKPSAPVTRNANNASSFEIVPQDVWTAVSNIAV